jgi:hypothetical protein
MDKDREGVAPGDPQTGGSHSGRPSTAQLRYLKLGLEAPGGKLPLFDENGQEISPKTIRACIDNGWSQPWFANPLKPDWLVCRITPAGREIVRAAEARGQGLTP